MTRTTGNGNRIDQFPRAMRHDYKAPETQGNRARFAREERAYISEERIVSRSEAQEARWIGGEMLEPCVIDGRI